MTSLQTRLLAFVLICAVCATISCAGKKHAPFSPIVYPELGPYPTPTTYKPPAGNGLIDPQGFGQVWYAPYAEEVILPEEIFADAPFEIEVHVSAEFRPAILNGYPGEFTRYPDNPESGERYYFIFDSGFEGEKFIATGPLAIDPPGIGEATSKFVYKIDGLSAGNHTFSYTTAKEKALGGIGVIYCGSKYDPQSPSPRLAGGEGGLFWYLNTEEITVPFTVLPPEEP